MEPRELGGAGLGEGDSNRERTHTHKHNYETQDRYILQKHTQSAGKRELRDERKHFTGQGMKSKEESMITNTSESGFLESVIMQ